MHCKILSVQDFGRLESNQPAAHSFAVDRVKELDRKGENAIFPCENEQSLLQRQEIDLQHMDQFGQASSIHNDTRNVHAVFSPNRITCGSREHAQADHCYRGTSAQNGKLCWSQSFDDA